MRQTPSRQYSLECNAMRMITMSSESEGRLANLARSGGVCGISFGVYNVRFKTTNCRAVCHRKAYPAKYCI